MSEQSSTAPPTPGSERDEDFWRQFLEEGGDTWKGIRRRLFKHIPADPGCRMCASPFAGPGLRSLLVMVLSAILAGCGAFITPTPALVPAPSDVPGMASPDTGPSTVPSGDGAAAPVPSEVEPAPPPVDGPDTPPLASINGVAGVLVTFCWKMGCVDGVPPAPEALPAVGPPLDLQLPNGATVEGVTAWNGLELNPRSIEVPFEGATIGELPAGTAMLSVFVRFEGGGDASYFWGYAAPAPSASAGP